MNWLVKVAAFKMLSAVPGGTALYRLAQEKITHSLAPTPARVNQKIEVGLRYWNWLSAHSGNADLLGGTHVDFGAGWHPTIPLLFYSMGVARQHLFDISPLLNRELIDATVKTYLQIVTDKSWPHRALLRRLPEPNSSNELSWIEYLRQLGITYHAPYETVFAEISGTIDIVTSTQVLMHIPREVLLHCFRQINGCLKSGGKFLAVVHLNDLHAFAGPGISQYNHLKFSPQTWEKWINSPLMAYNRLKAPDYRELLEASGFQIAHFEVDGPNSNDLRELEQIPIHACFNRYSREELGGKHLFFVAEKPHGAGNGKSVRGGV